MGDWWSTHAGQRSFAKNEGERHELDQRTMNPYKARSKPANAASKLIYRWKNLSRNQVLLSVVYMPYILQLPNFLQINSLVSFSISNIGILALLSLKDILCFCMRSAGNLQHKHQLETIKASAQSDTAYKARKSRGGVCTSWVRGHTNNYNPGVVRDEIQYHPCLP